MTAAFHLNIQSRFYDVNKNFGYVDINKRTFPPIMNVLTCTCAHTSCNLITSTGGVYPGLFGGGGGRRRAEGGGFIMSPGRRVLSPSLTPTNIHLVSSLHPRSETDSSMAPPSLPLPSVCLCLTFILT